MSRPKTPSSFLRPFFRWFDRVFFWIRDRYVGLVGHSLGRKFRYLFVYVLLVGGGGLPVRAAPQQLSAG